MPPAQAVQKANVREELAWRPRKTPIRYEGTNFKMVEDMDDIKYVLD